MSISSEPVVTPINSSQDTIVWAGISVPLHSAQITVMASFGLYWMYCQDPQTEESISKAEAVKSYILRICADLPLEDYWAAILPEHQQALLISFGQISSSGKTLRDAVGFFKKTTDYTFIKTIYSQVASIITNEKLATPSLTTSEIGYFITLQSGATKFSLFTQEIQQLREEERRTLQKEEVRTIVEIFRKDPYSRIRLVYILMALASVDGDEHAHSAPPGYITDLDELDKEESPEEIEPIFGDELKNALVEFSKHLLDPQTPLPEISPYCARQLFDIFSGVTEKAKNKAELMLVASTNNEFLSRFYKNGINDEIKIKNRKSSLPRELILQTVRVTNVIQIGIFFYENQFLFSEEALLRTIFSSEIKEIIGATKSASEFEPEKLRNIIEKYFPGTNDTDLRAIILAIDNGSEAELIGSLIESIRQRPYLQELLDLPLPSLRRCKSILVSVLADPQYQRIPNQSFRLQRVNRFSPQGLIDYLQMYLENATAFYLNVKGKVTAVSVFDALKANASSTPVYASLTASEIASYATTDEAYGLINQAASLIKGHQEEPLPDIDTLLSLLAMIRSPFGISEKKLNKFRSVTPPKFLKLFTEKLNLLSSVNEKNAFKLNVSTVLTELHKNIRSSLSDKKNLGPDDEQLLFDATPSSFHNMQPPVGWFVHDKTGEVIYTLNAQKALSLARLFTDLQEENEYNQPIDLEDFPAGLVGGDIRLLTVAGLLVHGKVDDAKYIFEKSGGIPPFSTLALKQWSNFVLESPSHDAKEIVDNDYSLRPMQKLLGRRDISAVARHVAESLSAISPLWPKEIDKIQKALRTTTPQLLIFANKVFYNEFDFWAAVWERRLAKAQSIKDISIIIEEMFPDGFSDPDENALDADIDSIPVTNILQDSERLEESARFFKGNVPTAYQISDRILKQNLSEIDMGWIYERSRSFLPLFHLLTHLFRVNGVTLPPEINVFLQRGLTSSAESNAPSSGLTPTDPQTFQVSIDPRRLPIHQGMALPPIYYNANYRLSEEEITSTYLNNLLNPQTSYPYDAVFTKVDFLRLFSLGSLDAIRQLLSQVLCCPFPDFPARYPLATRLGLNNTWEQTVDVMGAFLKATNNNPDLLMDVFRSCFPQEPPDQLEKAWLYHSLAVMILMLFWARNKKLSQEEHLTYALAGLWHNLGMIEFGGAFSPNRGGLRGGEALFNEYLTHQKNGSDIFNSAWERWFPNGDGALKQKEAINQVILYHHVKPRTPIEISILQKPDDIVAVSYIANSITHATLSVMYVHAKGAGFETTLDNMLTKLARSDSAKFHLPAKIRELFPNFCGLIRTIVSSKTIAEKITS
ncbi:hypothetical protein CCP3SC1_120015 [Gammaproteobacteria bacterium]